MALINIGLSHFNFKFSKYDDSRGNKQEKKVAY